jgi:membrane-associated phospholipid phosphatase
MYDLLLKNLFNYIGNLGPLFLFFFSLFFLWNKENLLFYYILGTFVNIILNLIIKGLVQQPRPLEDEKLFKLALQNGNRFVFKDGIPFDIFGMPSGHAQYSLFSTMFIYLSLRRLNILYIYAIISIITLIQRVVYKYHTIFQIFVGSIIGIWMSYIFYILSQQKIKGKIREKVDDFGPI